MFSRLTGFGKEDPPACLELFMDSLTGLFDPNRLDPDNRIGLFCLNLAGLNSYRPSSKEFISPVFGFSVSVFSCFTMYSLESPKSGGFLDRSEDFLYT